MTVGRLAEVAVAGRLVLPSIARNASKGFLIRPSMYSFRRKAAVGRYCRKYGRTGATWCTEGGEGARGGDCVTADSSARAHQAKGSSANNGVGGTTLLVHMIGFEGGHGASWQGATESSRFQALIQCSEVASTEYGSVQNA